MREVLCQDFEQSEEYFKTLEIVFKYVFDTFINQLFYFPFSLFFLVCVCMCVAGGWTLGLVLTKLYY